MQLSCLLAGVLAVGLALEARADKRVLMVVTSHDRIDENHPTGLWLEEFATPYELFRAEGYAVTVASPKGGAAPVDPRSLADESRFKPETLGALKSTAALAAIPLKDFDAVFFPGGHGTMYDLPNDPHVATTVTHFITQNRPLALVCHGPAALVGATLPDGSPAVKGRKVTAFTDAEERAVELDDEMPFLLETKLREQGGSFVGADNFVEHVVVDGNLVTGQNPASSEATARALIRLLQ